MIADEKKLNATYIISVARKLGCSIFLLPEDIMEVKKKTFQIPLFCLFIHLTKFEEPKGVTFPILFLLMSLMTI